MKAKSEEKKVFCKYSKFFLAEETLTEEAARKELLETLRSFRGIDGRFLSSASFHFPFDISITCTEQQNNSGNNRCDLRIDTGCRFHVSTTFTDQGDQHGGKYDSEGIVVTKQ